MIGRLSIWLFGGRFEVQRETEKAIYMHWVRHRDGWLARKIDNFMNLPEFRRD